MGKKSRNPNKNKSKAERDRNLSEKSMDSFLKAIEVSSRRNLPITTCRHMTCAIDEEQKREIKIFMGRFLRELTKISSGGVFSAPPSGGATASAVASAFIKDNNFDVTELICSPATSRNIEGMAQMLLSTATNYLLEYEYKAVDGVVMLLLNTYWVLEEMMKSKMDARREEVAKLAEKIMAETDCQAIDTKYGIAKILSKKLPCDCLRDLKRHLQITPRMATCANCGTEVEAESILFCGRCKCRNYCTVECQREEWKSHKTWCKAMAAMRTLKPDFTPSEGK